MAGQVRLRDQFAALERAMRDWELVDSDRFSFEDSDRFEEDSLCSWISEPESLCNNWRGWKKSTFANLSASTGATLQNSLAGTGYGSILQGTTTTAGKSNTTSNCPSNHNFNLVELSAKTVASHIPFEMVERFYPPVPEQLQLRIAFWSFPEHEEDIRLYSCLANGSAEEFQKGERFFRNDSVCDILQIGFHLSATVKPNLREIHKVAVTFDRRRVTSCTCTCGSSHSSNWCSHVVAVCLHRIYQSKDVMLRAPVSESLSRLHRDQLQKFAQYLISELPQQILPTAQRLLDELLSSQRSAINTLRGAPDPTAGASVNEQTSWFLDERTLHGNIHKILIKFCVPAPIVFSDVNYLSNAAPPASAEWSSLLRPLRGREPEGMWNLLSIVREMFRRGDRNAIPLLEIITEECLNCDQILVWWFNTKVALHNGNGHGGKHHSVNSNTHACQHAGASLCDEIVFLWRLAALNPGCSPEERRQLLYQFKEWHLTKIIEKVAKSRNASVGSKHANSFKNDVEIFSGFRPAIEACYLNWENYPIHGVTFKESSQTYHCAFMHFRHTDTNSRSGMIHSSHAILNNPAGEHHLLHSSATISSAPHMNKRPRSVDFGGNNANGASGSGSGGVANNEASSSSTTRGNGSSSQNQPPQQGSSNSKSSNKNNKKKIDKSSSSKIEIDMSLCLNLTKTLKLKEKPQPIGSSSAVMGSSLEQSSSNDEEIVAGPSCKIPPYLNNPQRSSPSGNRSSVSSEGFCENEIECDVLEDPLKDEGVELVENQKGLSATSSSGPHASTSSSSKSSGKNLTTTAPTTTTNTSDELEGDIDIDDSDESVSAARSSAVNLVVNAKSSTPKAFDSSDSHSGDEYQLYYYDPKAPVASNSKREFDENGKKDALGLNIFSGIKPVEDPWEVLFARAEGLHAHGHNKEACKLGVKLARELLANPPDLSLDVPLITSGKGKRKKINPASHQISCLASATLAKCGFLCTVLAENSAHHYLAFKVGMFGLELARPPASTKPLEVKLANQEAELAHLLKRIPIGQKEIEMVRIKAESLRDGNFKSRGEALLPLVLANFIFDALVMPSNREGKCVLQHNVFHDKSDEVLGFDAAVAALGLKANVSEAEHPLLCEGTRRQRGDLALSILLHYKDDSEKLTKVMDKLLDREIHQLYKTSLPSAYYSNNPPTTTLLGSNWNASNSTVSSASSSNINNNTNKNETESSGTSTLPSSPTSSCVSGSSPKLNGPLAVGGQEAGISNDVAVVGSSNSNQSRPQSNNSASAEGNSPITVQNSNSPPNPTSINNNSNNSNNNSAKENGTVIINGNGSNGNGRSGKESRFKGKRNYPILPNQPSEAGAHFMFELAKIVLGKAGGSSNQSLFTQPGANGANPRGPHRALHMCAFHIGLYALGLHNAVSPNWLSRTYSSHVSWITGQAMEIGAPAIAFLIDTWESHLTPPEAVTIADRASRGDANMVRSAAELALSCLPFSHALNPNEIHRAILQCKEQSDGMLEKACLTVESAAKGGGVYPEVLFDVARQWYSLYQKHLPHDVDLLNDEANSLLSMDDSMNHGISIQTGLPLVGPNNPPPPPPSTTSNQQQQQPMEMMSGPPPSLQHNPYSGQVPLATIAPYPSPYGQLPFIPATFNPAGNFVYGQTVIYQASGTPNTSAVATSTAAAFYTPPSSQSSGPGPTFATPLPIHSSMVTAGPALQYFNPLGGGPITQRATAQFFPISGMNIHPIPTSSHQLTPPPYSNIRDAQMAQNMNNSLGNGHLVAVSNPSNSCVSTSNQFDSRNFMPDMRNYMSRPPPGGPSMNCSNPIMNHQHHNGSFNQGMGMIPCDMPSNMNNNAQMQGNNRDGIPTNGGSIQNQQSATKVKYLLAAYRVGMLAMETLARRSHDDRPAAKFARNPTYGEDVKWLLSISRKLGAQYLQQFCICAVSSIANPFVLHEIILDAALVSTRNNLSLIYQNPRSPLAPLVQKCQQMYFQCLHQKLYHITLSDYEDFVSIVCTARQAFHLTPDGASQFKEWLQNLRRSKACKKELWQQITTAIQANTK